MEVFHKFLRQVFVQKKPFFQDNFENMSIASAIFSHKFQNYLQMLQMGQPCSFYVSKKPLCLFATLSNFNKFCKSFNFPQLHANFTLNAVLKKLHLSYQVPSFSLSKLHGCAFFAQSATRARYRINCSQ